MAQFPTLDETVLEFNDAPRLIWLRVQEAAQLIWRDNPKRHDIGGVIESIQRYGFQEPAKLDTNLPSISGGQGAIKAGNGRVEALLAMERDGHYDLPRGIAKDTDGAWCVPLLIGTDAHSEEMAAAYGIDANNLTLAGGDLTAFDYMRMYEKDYTALLERLAQADELPVSVGADTLDTLKYLSDESFVGDAVPDLEGWDEPDKAWRVIIQCETEDECRTIAESLGLEFDGTQVSYRFEDTRLNAILQQS